MKFLWRYGKRLFFTIISIILLLFMVTILYYSNFINEGTYNFLKLFITLTSIFVNAIILGKSSNNSKGYMDGIMFGLLIILLILIPTLIANKLELKLLVYYGMILGTTTLGSMFGKSTKKNKK